MKRAFITGITGQDGSYLAELLLAKGYEVHGLIRRSSTFNTDRIDHLYTDPHEESNSRLRLHYGDLTDGGTLLRLLAAINPDEIYNLAAQSHVRVSFDCPEYTADVVAMGTLRLLEAVRALKIRPHFYQASSSELFGDAGRDGKPLNERSPFRPRSPYACAKLHAYWTVVNHREAYGLFACNGILFNHESPRRGQTFVTRKIVRGLARICKHLSVGATPPLLYLGNLDARRDWGYAPEYVEAMWRMLQHDEPDDFVIATGESHTVREFLEVAFARAGLGGKWQDYVKIDPRYFRPTEVDALLGDSTRARDRLGWRPQTSFVDLVSLMVTAALREER